MHRSIAAALALLLISFPVLPCSTLLIARDGEVVFGRNYDFEIGNGLVLVNQRGLVKTSIARTRTWTAKYGSITFNQFGREFPMDGMNEAGLAVALMWLNETVYPPPDARPQLGVLEWIQYQLDNFGTVAEVIEHANEVRIVRGGTPLHYLIGDATGAAATIEFLDGQLVVHTGPALPTANLTNSTYESSVDYLRGRRSMPSGSGSLERFARTAMLMQRGEAALSILDQVAQPNWTRWSVAYDLARREITWKTLTSRQEKSLRLSQVNFACSEPMLMIDANTPASGNIAASLQRYTPDANLNLMIDSYGGTSFLRDTPREDIEATAAHAEASRCAGHRPWRGAVH